MTVLQCWRVFPSLLPQCGNVKGKLFLGSPDAYRAAGIAAERPEQAGVKRRRSEDLQRKPVFVRPQKMTKKRDESRPKKTSKTFSGQQWTFFTNTHLNDLDFSHVRALRLQ
jgi:hypothetical protein